MKSNAARLQKALEERERRGLGTVTAERLGHSDGTFTVVEQAQRVRQSALEILAGQGKLSERQIRAATRFAEDAYDAGAVWSYCALEGPPDDDKRNWLTLDNFATVRWLKAVRALPGWALSQVENIIWPLDSGIGAGAQLPDRMAAIDVGAVQLALGLLADYYVGKNSVRQG